MKTIVLLSGGLDSATILAACVKHGDECLAIGFYYDQPHHFELGRARQIARHYFVPFEVINLPAMPRVNDVVFAGRNLVFAAMAIAIAQARGFDRIAIGPNAGDWKLFPDCRPEFWRNLERCAEAYGIGVFIPLIYADKGDVVETARRLQVPIDLTWSCYDPQDGKPCGKCLACNVRTEALAV